MSKYKNNRNNYHPKISLWQKIKFFLKEDVPMPNYIWLLVIVCLFLSFIDGCSDSYKVYEYQKIIKEDYGLVFDSYSEYESFKNTYEK